MKVNLTYSDMTLIVGIVEKELKELRDGIARMKSELTAINKAAENGAAMCEEVEMKEEEPKKKKCDWSKVRRGNRSRFYTAAQDNVIREMRSDGKSFQEIADQLGRTKEAVRKRAQVIL